MKIKLAEALLRRKELQEKLDVLARIKQADLFETKAQRVRVTDSLDDVIANVPKLTASQFTREFDWHARQLREVDAVIQQANWSTNVEVKADNMADFTE